MTLAKKMKYFVESKLTLNQLTSDEAKKFSNIDTRLSSQFGWLSPAQLVNPPKTGKSLRLNKS
jgi:hypothetical protein